MNPASHALQDARSRIRSGEWTGPTSGMAPDQVQGNMVPKPCPLIGVSDPGDPRLPALGDGIDIRSDVPRYRVFDHGRCVDEPFDVKRWRTAREACRVGNGGADVPHLARHAAGGGGRGELPVFWACGVTPQAVVEAAKVPFCITHYPGAMLITDLRNAEISVF